MSTFRRQCLMLLLVGLVGCGSQSIQSSSSTVPATTIAQAPTATAVLTVVQPSPTTTQPTPTLAQAAFFTHPQTDPIVAHGAAADWDSTFTDPGAVIFQDGKFHMFRNGFRGWPASVQIGYGTSTDGLTWEEQDTEPVFKTEQVPFAGTAALASSVIVQDDGTWVLYFYTWEKSNAPAPSHIGRATAPNPTGPWTVTPQPILELGAAGAWDEYAMRAPHVILVDGAYRMYYSALDAKKHQAIGMATSPDGIHWTKYDDPATTDALYADSDPIFVAGEKGAWDAAFVHQPRVLQTPDGWVLFYRAAADRSEKTMALGYATSTDGIRWTRSAQNPILRSVDIGKPYFWFTNVLYHAETYYLFWEVDSRGTTDIHVAIHQGSLK